MNESVCSTGVEVAEGRGTVDKPGRKACSPKQLMCSQNREEIESVRDALSEAGIATDIRNNATAEALGITGVELWVKQEEELSEAIRIYSHHQARFRGQSKPSNAPAATAPSSTGPEKDRALSPKDHPPVREDDARPDRLDADTSALEEQLDEMIEFQRQLLTQCVSVRGQTKELRRGFADRLAAFSVENEKRTAAHRRLAEEISTLQSALQHERLEHGQTQIQLECERNALERMNEQLERARLEWQHESRAQEDSSRKTQEKLDVQARLLHTHAAAILKLRKELEAAEAQRVETQKALGQVREELATERKARAAAEQELENLSQSSLRLPSLLFRRLSSKKTA